MNSDRGNQPHDQLARARPGADDAGSARHLQRASTLGAKLHFKGSGDVPGRLNDLRDGQLSHWSPSLPKLQSVYRQIICDILEFCFCIIKMPAEGLAKRAGGDGAAGVRIFAPARGGFPRERRLRRPWMRTRRPRGMPPDETPVSQKRRKTPSARWRSARSGPRSRASSGATKWESALRGQEVRLHIRNTIGPVQPRAALEVMHQRAVIQINCPADGEAVVADKVFGVDEAGRGTRRFLPRRQSGRHSWSGSSKTPVFYPGCGAQSGARPRPLRAARRNASSNSRSQTR